MIGALLKRTTFVVADAEAAARFYREVFGYTVWYDNELPVDGRFPPLAPDGAMAHLVILQVEDPKIGMLGFLSYRDFRPADDRHGSPPRLGLGTPILVMESRELDALHERARAAGAHIVTPPVTWQVPGRDGGPPITLRAFSMFDPNGIYLEISAARDQGSQS